MFKIILTAVLAFIVWYIDDKQKKKNIAIYLPQVKIAIDPSTNKVFKPSDLIKVTKKIRSNQELTSDDTNLLKAAYNMTPEDYIVEEKEKHNAVIYTPSNEVPSKGLTRIRQNKDGYVYFSIFYLKNPKHLYKVLDYSWGGPRYETTYHTTTTSKNKHLVPIINQKRTGSSRTTSSTTAHATLCQLLLIDMDTNDKILSEADILENQNQVISRFKIWADTSNQQNIQNNVNTTDDTNNSEDLDDLPKLKKLLDDGILTQEEFDAKKKQILGI